MLLVYTGKRSQDLSQSFFQAPAEHFLIHPFSRAISRLRHNNDLFHFARASEYLPDLIAQTKSAPAWADICAERALDLLKMDREHFYISYSGGIDSTVALASILANCEAHDIKRLRIILSHESIRENPTFFQRYVSRLPLFSSFTNISGLLIATNSVLVTGELGDQLFGSDILARGAEFFGQESLFKSYEEFVPLYLTLVGKQVGTDRAGQLFERIRPIVHESPFPIKTTHDFFWWYNFSQKWQYVKFRFTEKAHWDLGARYGSHVIHFFDDPDFQKWSILNHDLKLFGNWSNYKFAAKEYLFNFTKDSSQRNLLKVQSLKNNYMYTRKRVAIAENYDELTYEDLKAYVRR
ncbi:MAG: hypothetical protein ACK5P7_02500 [Bdellovibrio sp.]